MGDGWLIPFLAGCVWALVVPAMVTGQNAPEEWRQRLQQVVPAADSFSDRLGQPPVFEAYAANPENRQRELVGYAFLTSDLPPEQRGFTGPIEALVGMDRRATITGVLVIGYTESHKATRGDFLSVEGFQEQFAGKSILDAFRVGRDVEGISGATITVDAMSRGIRNAAREVAVANGLGSIAADRGVRTLDPATVTVNDLDSLSWPQIEVRGLTQQILVLGGDRAIADVTLVHLRNEGVAEALMGRAMLNELLARAGPSAFDGSVVLAGVDGPAAGALNLLRLSIVQDGDTIALAPPDILLFGPPRAGKLDGQFRMLRLLRFNGGVDMTRSLSFVLDLRPALGVFSARYPGEGRSDGEDPEAAPGSLGRGGWRGLVLLAFIAILFVGVSGKRTRLRRDRTV
jgi:NosR/NirI family transcriptional regulator, nitrous oxide reductase regulator